VGVIVGLATIGRRVFVAVGVDVDGDDAGKYREVMDLLKIPVKTASSRRKFPPINKIRLPVINLRR
jgi:hypothetical protein